MEAIRRGCCCFCYRYFILQLFTLLLLYYWIIHWSFSVIFIWFPPLFYAFTMLLLLPSLLINRFDLNLFIYFSAIHQFFLFFFIKCNDGSLLSDQISGIFFIVGAFILRSSFVRLKLWSKTEQRMKWNWFECWNAGRMRSKIRLPQSIRVNDLISIIQGWQYVNDKQLAKGTLEKIPRNC